MPIIRKLEDLNSNYPNPVITLGNFDGVHLGHQALFDLVKKRAAEIGGTSMVLTFEPHPIRVINKNKLLPLITLNEQKMELIESSGIDVIICLDFTPETARIEAEDFVRRFLVESIGVKLIIIGYDFRFGFQGRGNRDLLIEMGRQYGFSVETFGAQYNSNQQIISSTLVRELITAGEVEKAPALLGRHYRVTGQVVRGRDRGGKMLGFPTANLKVIDELIPKTGVYAVKVIHNDACYNGVANIGFNPTFGDVGLSVEVHCFDFDSDIYDQTLKVDFQARIRDEKKFSGPGELKEQIEKDCRLARGILEKSSEE
ncbi:MAG: bifunctional riboflavin kinase/FAD synthetase [Deltaproteobacteria bacterium]|nr:bifunctional riboflavin kinase/FAD synthetase [Deltaproteobacteria bacterium]MBW2053452.1 bifunctional riboflavin kinase/FAD synthetase [Deltaproteobacteria bacterium]MBW2142009.1 bifunctional riboflavin kinase/FAD synthetase [Deltaproteobacteria bacterium]MBW2323880.1 bifunctional riboflavin kinase/FAD synthetase [Deltaproteobacteria bacterium]